MLGIGKSGLGAQPLSADIELLQRAVVRKKAVGPRHDILNQGDAPQVAHLLIAGHIFRYRLLSNGRRQITAILVPGDVCDLEAVIRGRADYGVAALTDCSLAEIPRERIVEPSLGDSALLRTLMRRQLRDEAITREWLVGLGQRSAVERLGHLFCELWVRLDAVGLASADSFEMRITQGELAEATGITSVHLSRVLRQMRGAGLIRLSDGTLTILNWAELERMSGFEAGYLQAI